MIEQIPTETQYRTAMDGIFLNKINELVNENNDLRKCVDTMLQHFNPPVGCSPEPRDHAEDHKTVDEPLRDGDVRLGSATGRMYILDQTGYAVDIIKTEHEFNGFAITTIFNILDFSENIRKGLIPIWLTKDEANVFLNYGLAYLKGSPLDRMYNKIAAAMEKKP
jgi:hypothetical protein